MRIGVLGGTFDPPHLGHLALAQIALSSGEVDQVVMVPCRVHAFGKKPVSFEHRIAMCRSMVNHVDGIWVSDIERDIGLSGRTLETLLALKKQFPAAVFRLLAGADIVNEAHNWYRFDEVAKLAPPLFVARKGVDATVDLLQQPPAVSSSAVRRELALGQRPKGLADSVFEYITTHQLYGVGYE